MSTHGLAFDEGKNKYNFVTMRIYFTLPLHGLHCVFSMDNIPGIEKESTLVAKRYELAQVNYPS
jgi:hypothetical protein